MLERKGPPSPRSTTGTPPRLLPRGFAVRLAAAALVLATVPSGAGCASWRSFYSIDGDALDEGFDAVCIFRVRSVDREAAADMIGLAYWHPYHLVFREVASGVPGDAQTVDLHGNETRTTETGPGSPATVEALDVTECRSGEYALIGAHLGIHGDPTLFFDYATPVPVTVVSGAVNYFGTLAFELVPNDTTGTGANITASMLHEPQQAAVDLALFAQEHPAVQARFGDRVVDYFSPPPSAVGAATAGP
jgi:hypothetical protein